MKFQKPEYTRKPIGLIAIIALIVLFIILAFIVKEYNLHTRNNYVTNTNNQSGEEKFNQDTTTATATETVTESVLYVEPISENTTSVDKIEMQQVPDKITSEKETKTYEFTSTETGRYRFELSDVPQNTWFKFYLYNASMEQLDYGSGDNEDGITADLDADTEYYFVVEQCGNTGSYTLNVGSQKPVIDISDYTSINDSTQFKNQRNIYKFTSFVEGTYRFELSNISKDTWFNFYLYNSSMEQLEYGSVDNGDSITADLDADTEYYFVVEQGWNTGDYTMNYGVYNE